jgi:predicted amidohydrolase
VIIALASPRVAETIDDGLDKVMRLVSEASARGAEVVCFPEAYLPGLRGQDFEVPPFDEARQERVLRAASQWAREYSIATIIGTEKFTEAGRHLRRARPTSGLPDEESARPERRPLLRAGKHAPTL